MKRRSVLVSMLLMFCLGVAVGCSTSPPPAAELVETNTELLTDVTLKGARAVLAQTPASELVVTVWKDGGTKGSFRGGSLESSRPVVGWVQGFQGVAGRFAGQQGARVEVTTDSGTVTGKLERGAYLVVWPVSKLTGRFVLRVYDAQGKELFRWAPTSGPSAA